MPKPKKEFFAEDDFEFKYKSQSYQCGFTLTEHGEVDQYELWLNLPDKEILVDEKTIPEEYVLSEIGEYIARRNE